MTQRRKTDGRRRRLASSERLRRFRAALSGRRRPLILSHNNPDPDALASCWGIKLLVEMEEDVEATVCYSGLLGRAENRAMIRALDLHLHRLEEIDPTHFDSLVLVDCQPGAGNVTAPVGIAPLVVIDHHPRSKGLKGIPFVDVRATFGSCIALIYEYLAEAGLQFDCATSTAFYYAIRSDTQELGREAGASDRRLFRKLTSKVDWRLLHRIVHAPAPRSYYVTFKVALENARLYRDALFADAGELPIPDAAAEIADWLLRLDEVNWALACGTYRGKLHFSLRSLILGAHCGALSQQIVAGWGSAGGHGLMAGGQVRFSEPSYDRAEALAELERRFVRTMGYEEIPPIADPFAVIPGELSRKRTGR